MERSSSNTQLSAKEVWHQAVLKHNITDETNLVRLYSYGLKVDQLKEIFPYTAINGTFDDEANITITVARIRDINSRLKQEKESGRRKDDNQLQNNGKELKNPKHYQAMVEKDESIHPRLFHNLPLLDAGLMFTMVAKNKHMIVPTDAYNFTHINTAGIVTTKGWYDAHNPACQSFSLKNYTRKNSLKYATGHRRFAQGSENDGPWIETEPVLDEILNLAEAEEAWFMYKAIKQRASPLDFSHEPLDRFLARNAWFTKHADLPSGVDPGTFAAGFIDSVMIHNAARCSSGLPFAYYTELAELYKHYVMNEGHNLKASSVLKPIDNKRSSSQNSKRNNIPLTCKFFNMARGCTSKGSSCGSNGKYKHLCNHPKEGGGFCRGEHSRINHPTKNEK